MRVRVGSQELALTDPPEEAPARAATCASRDGVCENQSGHMRCVAQMDVERLRPQCAYNLPEVKTLGHLVFTTLAESNSSWRSDAGTQIDVNWSKALPWSSATPNLLANEGRIDARSVRRLSLCGLAVFER